VPVGFRSCRRADTTAVTAPQLQHPASVSCRDCWMRVRNAPLLFVDNVDTVQHVYDTIRAAIHEYGGAATRSTCVRAACTL
jgi:hypothetical protein